MWAIFNHNRYFSPASPILFLYVTEVTVDLIVKPMMLTGETECHRIDPMTDYGSELSNLSKKKL